MTSDQPKKTSTKPLRGASKTSLRDLAARCNVGHSTLSKAIHEHRLVAGVRIDGRGRVVVVDATAAAAEWNAIHVPELPELIREEEAAKAGARTLRPHQDHNDGRSWNARDLIAFVLVEAALDDEDARVFVKRITARLCEAATRGYADDLTVTDASNLLLELVSDAVEAAREP